MTIVRSTAYVLTTTSMWTHLSQWAQSVCLESTFEPILPRLNKTVSYFYNTGPIRKSHAPN